MLENTPRRWENTRIFGKGIVLKQVLRERRSAKGIDWAVQGVTDSLLAFERIIEK